MHGPYVLQASSVSGVRVSELRAGLQNVTRVLQSPVLPSSTSASISIEAFQPALETYVEASTASGQWQRVRGYEHQC
ncbi:MAG: hypothetical protein GY740_24135, partial [Gammaproteobacteria bacterium]|nr:hypothetical protein [Gammaproteobacteria bacterium]